jgi:hypothetical protein
VLNSLSLAFVKAKETVSTTISRRGLCLSLLLFTLMALVLGAMEGGHVPESRGLNLVEASASRAGVEPPSIASPEARQFVFGSLPYVLGWSVGISFSVIFGAALGWVGCRTVFVIYEGVVSSGITFRKSFAETSTVGNSLFFFWFLWFVLAEGTSVLTIFLLGSPAAVGAYFAMFGFMFIAGLCFWVVGGVVVPIMGHDRVGILRAWQEWVRLFQKRPGVMLLYFPASFFVGVLSLSFVVVAWVCVFFLVGIVGGLVVGAPWFLAGGSFSSLPTSGWVWLWLVPSGFVLGLSAVSLGLSSVVPATVFYKAWSLSFLQGFFPERFSFFPLQVKEADPAARSKEDFLGSP